MEINNLMVVCFVAIQSEIENAFYISNSADKTQMSGHKGLAKINEPP